MSRRDHTALAIALTGLAVFAAPSTATASAGGDEFTANLTGAVEVPPGDPDGRGSAHVTLRDEEVCFALRDVQGVAPVTAGHIHRGEPGVAGPIVVPLLEDPAGLPTEETFNSETTCVDADPAVISEIRDNPSGFYVNLHNAEFPAGAIRGQLAASELPRTGNGVGEAALVGSALAAAGAGLMLAAARRRRPANE